MAVTCDSKYLFGCDAKTKLKKICVSTLDVIKDYGKINAENGCNSMVLTKDEKTLFIPTNKSIITFSLITEKVTNITKIGYFSRNKVNSVV